MKHLSTIFLFLFCCLTLLGQKIPIEDIRIVKISKNDSLLLIRKWNQFLEAINNKDKKALRASSINKVYCSVCDSIYEQYDKNEVVPIDTLINRISIKIENLPLWQAVKMEKYKLTCEKYMDTKPINFNLQKGQKLIIYSITFNTFKHEELKRLRRKYYHSFQFVRINGILKFYGLYSS